MVKQDLVKLQREYEKYDSVNARVENLKKQLSVLTTDYYQKVYSILQKIINLRRTQIKGYGMTNLYKETNITLTPHQINYIFLQRFFSQKTKSLIDKGKLKTGTALFIIKQDKRFRDTEKQDSVVKRYIDGELKVDNIARLKEELIFNQINYDKETIKADKELVKIYYKFEEYLKLIKSKANLFSSEYNLKSLVSACERMQKELENILKFGKSVKKTARQSRNDLGELREVINEDLIEEEKQTEEEYREQESNYWESRGIKNQ